MKTLIVNAAVAADGRWANASAGSPFARLLRLLICHPQRKVCGTAPIGYPRFSEPLAIGRV
jgi:hypothetical protein